MKRLYSILGLALILALTSCTVSRNYAQSPAYQDYNDYESGVNYQQFYDELSPYGNWISYPGYGYVWSPYEAGFAPYSTNGHWVYSTYGWTWVSNYRWGWAPFHYGRWFRDARFGWLWVPGYEWAPAWVAWRGGGGYYGWAPLGPGMHINISIGSIPYNNWYFVPGRYINHRHINRYYVRNNTTIIHNTTVINNNYYYKNRNNGYNAGPPVRQVERVTNSRIAPVRVVSKSTPGGSDIRNNQLAIYRPQVKEVNGSSNRPSRAISGSGSATTTDRAPSRTMERSERDAFQDNGIPAARSAQGRAAENGPQRPVRTPANMNSRSSTPSAAPTRQLPSRSGSEEATRDNEAPTRNIVEPRPVHVAPPNRSVTGDREIFREVPASRADRIPSRPEPAHAARPEPQPGYRPEPRPEPRRVIPQRSESPAPARVQPQRSQPQSIERHMPPAQERVMPQRSESTRESSSGAPSRAPVRRL